MGKFLRGLVVSVLVACPLAVSCDKYDDTEIREQLEAIVSKLYELEQKMNTEIEVLKGLLDGKILIQDVSTDINTGVTTVYLWSADGAQRELTLYPKEDMRSYVTYINSAGVDYWAYIDENGKKKLFLDENNEAIPVVADVPEVIVREDETYILIGGVEYPMSGNSIFSDYELIVDEITKEIYAVTFTFGENMSFTVAVDGQAGFMFVKNAGTSTEAISDFYVAAGMTGRVQFEAKGVIDYLFQAPDGWRVKEYTDDYGATFFNITAPSKEQVEGGLADVSGTLKVMSALEGGKTSMTKLELSTEPFREFAISLGKADIVPYNGISKFVYGVSEVASFDEAAAFAQAEALLDADDKGVSSSDIKGRLLSEMTDLTLTPGSGYVLWAVPAQYDEDGDSAYYLLAGTLVYEEFTHTSVSFEIGGVTIRDAVLAMDLKGVSAYYFGLQTKEDFDLADVVADLNTAGKLTPLTTPMEYNASVFALAGVESKPSTEYVAWMAVAGDGKKYGKADVIIREFTTLDLAPGGTANVLPGTVVAEALEITAALTAEGAESIYYAFIKPDDINVYPDAAAKAKFLVENGVSAAGASASAKLSEFPSLGAYPETDFILLAVAVDSQGKYGQVLIKECRTGAITFNSMVVNVEELKNSPKEMKLRISVTGGEAAGYLYWLGSTSDNMWSKSSYMGGSAETAQKYLYVNSSSEKITAISGKYPIEENVITMTDHTPGSEYVLVIMAKDNDGVYSEATAYKFTPNSVDIGTIVPKTDSKWEAAKPVVTFNPETFRATYGMMTGAYSFDVTLPAGFTGYVLAANDSFFIHESTGTTCSPKEKILTIIKAIDNRRDVDGVDSYYTYEHGDPSDGGAIIWADEAFHDARCGNDQCEGNHVETEVRYGEKVPVEHVVLYNDGNPVTVWNHWAAGSTQEVVDRVYIVCQDAQGNCYEAFEWDVPFEYFRDANAD